MRRKIIVVISIIAIFFIAIMAMKYFSSMKESPETRTPENIARKVKALPVTYQQVSYVISSTGFTKLCGYYLGGTGRDT